MDYQEPGALDVEPSIVNRRIYASQEEMLNERTAVGTWQLDEPYHDEEVLIFRALIYLNSTTRTFLANVRTKIASAYQWSVIGSVISTRR